MILKILFGLAAILIVFLVIAAMQPADFRVTRSATMSAPAPVVYEQVNELRKWEQWSPWAKLDPNMKNTYEGPASGVGATQSWVGNNQVGEGKMTITDVQPNERIGIKLEFVKPFAGTNDVTFTFQPEGEKTVVTWTMTGRKNFFAKAMGLFMSMDKMCGGQFEQGLATLKSIVEGRQGT